MRLNGKLFFIAAALFLAACQDEIKPRGHDSAAEIDAWSNGFADVQPPPKRPNNNGPVVMAREDGPAWAWDDPCVENLHELTGLLLLYYQQHKDLPEKLSDLPLKALGGGAAALTCPEGKKPYVYVHGGLIPPMDIVPVPLRKLGGDRLIVYDAEPSHEITQHLTNGSKDWDVKKKVRYGIVMRPTFDDAGQQTSLQLQVVPVEQDLLDAYVRETRRRSGQPNLIQPIPVRQPAAGGF